MNTSPIQVFDFTSSPLAEHLRDKDSIEGSRSLASAAGRPMSPRLIDLIRIARAAFLVDRAVPRYVSGRLDPYGAAWRRQLHVCVPTREASYWNSGVGKRVEALLSWLTDDAWSFSFEQDDQPEASELEAFILAPREASPAVLLFSGGLDSLAGAGLAVSQERDVALVSVHTNNRMKATQRRLVDELRFITPELVHVSIGMRAPQELKHNGLVTQRTRAFVFLVYGAALASQSGSPELRICENGIGALNLSYSRAQTGAQSTRAVHPLTLMNFSELMDDLSRGSLRVTNQFLYRTKAEVCSVLPPELRPLIQLTVSCDSGFSHRTTKSSACGRCSSCLLRQQGLRAAGLSEYDSVRYRNASPFDHVVDQSIPALDDMVLQIGDFERHLAASDAWRALTMAYGSIRELSMVERRRSTQLVDRAQLMRMLRTYCSEWRETAPTALLEGLGADRGIDVATRIAREAG